MSAISPLPADTTIMSEGAPEVAEIGPIDEAVRGKSPTTNSVQSKPRPKIEDYGFSVVKESEGTDGAIE